MKKAYAATVSILLFSSLLAWYDYVPVSEQEPNVLYDPINSHLMIYIFYVAPFYLIAGLPASVAVEIVANKLNMNKFIHYFVRLFLYAGSGLVIGYVGSVMLRNELLSIINHYSVVGIIASVLYFHILLLITYIESILIKRRII